jgi:hypothetical protein
MEFFYDDGEEVGFVVKKKKTFHERYGKKSTTTH